VSLESHPSLFPDSMKTSLSGQVSQTLIFGVGGDVDSVSLSSVRDWVPVVSAAISANLKQKGSVRRLSRTRGASPPSDSRPDRPD
jgi:hypothetical protein